MGTQRSSAWASLNPELVTQMRHRLAHDFDDFAAICEDIGLLSKNFVAINDNELAMADTDFACAMCASAVVSAANHYGSQGEFALAERLAGWALLLEPHHIPAFMCLVTVYQVTGNASKEAEMRNRMDTIIKQLSVTPEAQLSSFEQGILKSMGE